MLTSCPSDPILDSNTSSYLDCTSLWLGKMAVVWKFYHNFSFVRWSSLPIHSKKANISWVSVHTFEKVGSDVVNILKSDNCYLLLVIPKHRSSHFTHLLSLKDSLVQEWLSEVKDEYLLKTYPTLEVFFIIWWETFKELWGLPWWLSDKRMGLSVQRTWVPSLILEEPTCRGS